MYFRGNLRVCLETQRNFNFRPIATMFIIIIIIITTTITITIIIIIITSETGITIYNYKCHRKLVNVKRLKNNRLVCINLRPEYFFQILLS